MLSLAQGNISEAARASKKHRRAFWQLIRKHRIDTHHYREIQVQIRQGGALGGKAGYTH
jgi:hypothetical protein